MPQGSADQLQSIPMSPNLSQSFGRAKEFAREQNHRALLLEHLLLALTEDPEASGVLRACNVETVRLSTDISGYLGRLTEDTRAAPGTEPIPDAELLRVIEAARQAAQQSRRKTIDGAIVLAAIVGDGKSPAAGLLKTHGMTFDEAIKTLQKASAQARTKQYSASTAARTQPEPAASRVAKEAVREPAPPPAPAPERAAPGSAASQSASSTQTASGPAQTVDDILAAARARIQQRNIGTPAKAEPKPEIKPEIKPRPSPEPVPKAEPEGSPPTLSAAPAPLAPPSPDRPDPPTLSARLTAGVLGLPPTPAGSSPAPPLPPGPPPGGPSVEPSLPPSLPPRVFQRPAGDGGPRPPPPRWPEGAGRGGPDAADPALGARQQNGAPGGGLRRPTAEAGRPPARGGPPARAAGQRPAAGPLMEAIPRRMRVGTAAVAQVRISRDKVDGLMQVLTAGRAPPVPADAVLARVLSVRLLAPDGGFAIEAETPETQWIEASANQAPNPMHEDHLGWRWSVTPLAGGRHRLQLAVAARTVGRDGIGMEASPPDRIIEIAARANRLRRLVRWAFIALLFAAGVGLGRISHDKLALDLVDVASALWRNVLGLLISSGFLAG
jgi:hypothetical protein